MNRPSLFVGCALVALLVLPLFAAGTGVGILLIWHAAAPPAVIPTPSPTPNPANVTLTDRVAAWTRNAPRRLEVAAGYEFVVSQIESNAFAASTWPGTQQAIVLALATQTDAAVADQLDAWAPIRQSLRNELNALDKAGKLKSASDYATVLREIIAGLRR